MRAVNTLIIQNSKGMSVSLVDVGASVQFIKLPFASVADKSVTLGFNDAEDYWENPASLGVTVGRYANRIGNATFAIDGNVYHLVANEGENQLHGGIDNFGHKRWKIILQAKNKAIFSLVSPDGDQGFPGELHVKVTYVVTEENSLHILYEATSSKTTVLNLTDHSYFNLDGMDCNNLSVETPINANHLWIDAKAMTEVDENGIPTGTLLDVQGGPYDFRQTSSFVALKDESGTVHLDNNFVLNSHQDWQQQAIASLTSTTSGVKLDVFTTKPGIQAYAAQHLEAPFYPNAGFCLETQFFPDSPNHPHFPSAVLRAGETYRHQTIYRFSTI